ncbi:hypothetical protein [Corynebacterium variabile]|uniref:hypothetical protein n=1 Tax=Corynebacterium variabile TaxID=1727 RepID=UPI002899F0D4|nr:hypothetical protein [Corynebacterium variabile]
MSEASSHLRQVMGFFWPGDEGAHTPAGFIEALIRAVCKADDGNKDRLYAAFPAVVWGVKTCQELPKDVARGLILAEIDGEEKGPL